MNATPDRVFSLCAGHPVLDLVNTLDNRFRSDGPTELLTDYRAVLAFMEQSRLLDRATSRMLAENAVKADAERAVESVRELREAAAGVLYAIVEGSAPLPADVQRLEQFSQSARQHEDLVWSTSGGGDSKFVWEWRSAGSDPDLPVWILALQASALLTSDDLHRLHNCHSETCRWLFLDTSKNHTRRWCDMKVCGNRMKARRFQARRA